ncbi:Histone deacetylase complex subunit, partial [Coemansia sp. RSA 1694]
MRPSQEEEEHVSLCGLHQCFASHDNSRCLTVKQSYSNAPSTICGAGKSAVSLPSTCKPPHGKGGRRRRASSYSGEAYSAVSYNDVLSTGVGLVGTEDCKREPRAAYRTANAQASRGAKQEPVEPVAPNGGGGGGGGDSKDGDSKQKSGGQDSSGGHGAAGEKSDDGSDNEDDAGSEGSGSSEEDDGVVRCVCGERNDGELMIQCEICQVWQHTLCMGIRDEAHIPDKYYCEKCHPSDHPYINSRPRTMVLAEATALGASTMMRRSAVMAVAKMTAREEYRSASAAATIAASVAAAATSASAGAGGHGRKRAPAAPGRRGVSGGARKADAAQKPPRRTPRRKQQQPPPVAAGAGAESTGADGSEDDYAERGRSETPGTGGSGGSVERADGAEPPDHRGALKGARKAQTPKRAAAQGGGGGKRRRVDRPASPGPGLPGAEDAFAEGLVARMLGAASPASGRAQQQRNRAASTVAGAAALHADGQQRRRGRSAPGSPTQPSPSPPPPTLPLPLPLPAYAADCG